MEENNIMEKAMKSRLTTDNHRAIQIAIDSTCPEITIPEELCDYSKLAEEQLVEYLPPFLIKGNRLTIRANRKQSVKRKNVIADIVLERGTHHWFLIDITPAVLFLSNPIGPKLILSQGAKRWLKEDIINKVEGFN